MNTNTMKEKKGPKTSHSTTLNIDYKKPIETEIGNFLKNEHLYVGKDVIIVGYPKGQMVSHGSSGLMIFGVSDSDTVKGKHGPDRFPNTIDDLKIRPGDLSEQKYKHIKDRLMKANEVKLLCSVTEQNGKVVLKVKDIDIIDQSQ